MLHRHEMQVKIAFLCLAHNNFEFIDQLANYYGSDGDRLFLHIDSGVDDSHYTFANQQISVLPRSCRYRTRWGTYNIVEATNALLKAALESKQYNRYILISGADIPLLSKHELKERLAEDNSYFSKWATALSDNKQDYPEFFTKHYYYSRFTNPGEAYLTQNKVRIYTMLLLNKLISVLPNTSRFTFQEYIKGSQWWVMSQELAAYVHQQLSDEKISKQFTTMHAPDEKAIQTIAINSPYAEKIIFDNGQDSLKQGLHYIDWGYQNKSLQLQLFFPEAIAKARTLGCAFARKVPVSHQAEFIDFAKSL